MKQYGLIFDMDNTILDTHIDFAEMHRKTAETAGPSWKLPPSCLVFTFPCFTM